MSVFDRGFLFGDAIYEVICTSGRRPYKLGPHLDRLVASGDAIGLDIRPLRGDLEREVAALLDAAGPGEGELYIRIMVTGGACPNFDLVDGGPPVRIVMVKPLPTWDPRLFREGIRLQTVNPEEVVGRVAPWVKSNNRQANVMAHRRARAHGYDDGLFVDPDGLISEGPTWNVFCVEEGGSRRPAWGAGSCPGSPAAQCSSCASCSGSRHGRSTSAPTAPRRATRCSSPARPAGSWPWPRWTSTDSTRSPAP